MFRFFTYVNHVSFGDAMFLLNCGFNCKHILERVIIFRYVLKIIKVYKMTKDFQIRILGRFLWRGSLLDCPEIC